MHRGDRSAAPLCIFGTKILLPLLTVTRERCNDYHNCKYLPGSDSEASIYRRISLWHIPRVAAPFTLVIFRCSFVRSFVSLPPGSRSRGKREGKKKNETIHDSGKVKEGGGRIRSGKAEYYRNKVFGKSWLE